MYLKFSELFFNAFNTIETPDLVLCNPDLTPIGVLAKAYNINFNLQATEVSELTFDYPAKDNGEIVSNYDACCAKRYVHVKPYGYFRLEKPKIVSDGLREVKSCTAYSIETTFGDKTIGGFKELATTYKLYDPNNLDKCILGMIVNRNSGWAIGSVDSSLYKLYRTFEFDSKNLLDFIEQDVQKAFQCVFLFHTEPVSDLASPNYGKFLIDVISAGSLMTNPKAWFEYDNLVKQLEITENTDDMITAMTVKGAGDVDIHRVNPRGDNYLYNFDYYIDTDMVDAAFKTAWHNYETALEAARPSYSLLTQRYRSKLTEAITFTSKAVDAENQVTVYEKLRAAQIAAGLSNPSSIGYAQYTANNTDLDAAKIESSAAKQNAEAAETEAKALYSSMQAINESFAFSEYFTQDQIDLICRLSHTGELVEDTFVETDTEVPDIAKTDYTFNTATLSVTDGIVGSVSDGYGGMMYNTEGGTLSCSFNSPVYSSNDSSVTVSYATNIITASVRIGNVYCYNKSVKYVSNGVILTKNIDAKVISFELTNGIYKSSKFVDGTNVNGEISFTSGTLSIVCEGTVANTDSSITCSLTNGSFCFNQALSEVRKQSVSWELWEYAEDVFSRICKPIYEFEMDSINLFFAKEFEDFKNNLSLLDSVALRFADDKTYYPVLLGVSLSYEDKTSLKLTFSNKLLHNGGMSDFLDIISASSTNNTTIASNSVEWNSFNATKSKDAVSALINNMQIAANNAVVNANSQEVVFDETGIHLRKSASNGTYDDSQIWITNNMIAFSDDAWASAEIGIGKFTDSTFGQMTGVVAPAIVGTLLAGNHLRITTENGLDDDIVFDLGRDGFKIENAAIKMTTSNYANKTIIIDPTNGLMIGGSGMYNQNTGAIDSTKANFYVDTEGNLTLKGTLSGCDGTFTGELSAVTGTFAGELSAATGSFSGDITANNFYFKDGSSVKTLLSANQKQIPADYLNLKGITVTNSQGVATFTVDSNGNVSLNNASIAGSINMTSGSINWATVSDNGALSAANNAQSTATNAYSLADANRNPSYITATKITQTTIESPSISAGTLTSSTLNSGTITGSVISGGSIAGTNIYGGTYWNFTNGNTAAPAGDHALIMASSNGNYGVFQLLNNNYGSVPYFSVCDDTLGGITLYCAGVPFLSATASGSSVSVSPTGTWNLVARFV